MALRVLAPQIDASQVVSGKFDKSDLEATANKMFKGAGAGSACTEVDPPSGFSSQTDVTGSRALATNYQNALTRSILVVASINLTAAGCVEGYCDAATPPTTLVAKNSDPYNITARYCLVCFIVPPSYYYRVDASNGSVLSWVEYN